MNRDSGVNPYDKGERIGCIHRYIQFTLSQNLHVEQLIAVSNGFTHVTQDGLNQGQLVVDSCGCFTSHSRDFFSSD